MPANMTTTVPIHFVWNNATKLILTFPYFLKFQAVTPPSCSGICPKTTSVEAASQITPHLKEAYYIRQCFALASLPRLPTLSTIF